MSAGGPSWLLLIDTAGAQGRVGLARGGGVSAAAELKQRGAECVILGCTEIPMVLTEENSPLPPVDSTRLLARRAVDLCMAGSFPGAKNGWLAV